MVIKKEFIQSYEVTALLNIIRSRSFQTEFASLGYDTTDMGEIVAEI